MSDAYRFEAVSTLGDCRIDSPLLTRFGEQGFIPDGAKIMAFSDPGALGTNAAVCFERAGQSRRIFHDPATTTAAIITCGGLCPGLNNVIRSAVCELYFSYGVKRTLGVRFGYAGLNPAFGYDPVELTPGEVDHISRFGGTILGSSRGNQDPKVMADTLQNWGVNVLLCIGGDGTQRGAHALGQELLSRGARVSIVGVPKTIDNDVAWCERSFGYTSAASVGAQTLIGAHEEARGAFNGVGLVKLMGRDAGFIAAAATVAAQEVNFTLVPEQPFKLNAFLNLLEKRLHERHHAVVAVAEGAGQDLFDAQPGGTDASGNRKHQDIGLFLKDQIEQYFKQKKIPIALKYIDPSYAIRSVPANAEDAVLCDQYGRLAVHAAMAGRTDAVVCFTHGHFALVPSGMVTSAKRRLSIDSILWRAVIATTGQPAVMG